MFLKEYLESGQPRGSIDVEFVGVDENMVSQDELDFVGKIKDRVQIKINYASEISDNVLDDLKRSLNTKDGQDIAILFNLEVINVG